MTYTNPYDLDPAVSIKPIKILIIVTAIISILSALIDNPIRHYLDSIGPQVLFSISWLGVARNYLWQPVTYMFVHPTMHGISFTFVINLLFNMVLLWFVGSRLLKQFGTKPFLRLYFVSGILTGIIAYTIIAITGDGAIIAGCSPSVYAMLVVWSMVFPELEILLFMTFPVKSKWLVTGLLGINILIDLSQLNVLGAFIVVNVSFGL